jgi:hypothetical protein
MRKLRLQSISVKKISVSLRNRKTTDEVGASDTKSDSEDNGDDSWEIVVLKLNEMLENI